MTVYYNEIDQTAAHVLRILIEDGVIAPGIVAEVLAALMLVIAGQDDSP